jgi:polyisoprenoid-binding protein YceI
MKKLTFSVLVLLMTVLAACGSGPTETPATESAVEQATAPARPTPTTPAIITLEPDEEPYPPPVAQPAAPDSYPAPAAPQPASPSGNAYPGAEGGLQGDANVRVFTIVPEDSEAAYLVSEEFFSGAVQQLGQVLGLTDTVGRTREIEGEFALDFTAVNPLVSGEFTVDLRTLVSNESRRDNRIRSEWLESNRYPMAEFVATAVENFPANYREGQTATFQLLGNMTIREISQPVIFDVTAALSGNTIAGTATADMRMTDFGFNPPAMANLFTVADEFTVEITFTARETN